MLRQMIAKVCIAVMIVAIMIMSYTLPVMATVTHETQTARFQIFRNHAGGYPTEGELTTEELEKYDSAPWRYTVNGITVYKIRENDDNEFQNCLYCLDAKVTFPGLVDPYQEYENKGNFFDSTNSSVKKLHMGTSGNSETTEWKKNYQAVCWLLKNCYLSRPQNEPSLKNPYLKKAFENFEDERLTGKSADEKLSILRTYLTNDDIEVVQQEVIWRFTNGDSSEYVGINSISRENNIADLPSEADIAFRDKAMKHLYNYLITAANNPQEEATIDVPRFVDTNPKGTNDNDYYIVGPFKINPGTYTSSDYNVSILDQNNNAVSDYKVKLKGEDDFTNRKLNEIGDTEFSIYIPLSNKNINKAKVRLEYSTDEVRATLWQNVKQNEDAPDYQPVVLLTREATPYTPTLEVPLVKSESDLAIRKYIIKINDEEVNRRPTIDVTDLKSGNSTTAKYKHAKNEVNAKAGDTIVFEIRVYNEGDIPVSNVIIADAMPTGFEFDENNEINRTYDWKKAENGDGDNRVVYMTDYLKGELRGFNKETDSVPPSEYVQIAYKISNSAVSTKVLTTVSEIAGAGEEGSSFRDRDSNPQNNDYVTKDLDATNYSGDLNNKADLSDTNYYYKGYQDDDDFEKIKVLNPEKPAFDLSLKKFVSGKKGSGPLTSSREPKVNVEPLKKGKTDAEYTIPKTGVQVQVGDIITYTIRVYNEGQVDGYAQTVSDYLPEGLGYIMNYKENEDNYWELPKDGSNVTTITLGKIENAINNVNKSDFNDEVTSPSDVKVVIGKVKLTSQKLKAEETNTNNLIKAFDGTKLDYKDIKITCVVLSTDDSGNKLKNIGEIVEQKDKDKNTVEDIDSVPNSVDPDKYPDSEKRKDGTPQDDNDYENLSPEPEQKQNFDLALKKFITNVAGQEVKDRYPIVTKGTNGKPVITMPNKNPIKIANNELITYTIRVYNEGDTAGYAKEVSDNIPAGLVYVADNDINKKFGWKLYDKSGNETSDINQATTVKTDYLSKAKSEGRNEKSLLLPYDAANGKISYQDVQIVFKIDESKVDKSRNIINTAEITNDEDENGNPIDDVDSTPNNGKDGEDDLDKENVSVKFFDLALQKYLSKITITENGQTRTIDVKPTDGLQKVEIHRKRIDSTEVKFTYTIVVTNQGEIRGAATEIIDYIPEGLEFVPADNPGWTKVTDKAATTNALADKQLDPGQSAAVNITLKWKNSDSNFGMKENIAEISKDYNENGAKDIDSTPGNFVKGEDDQDSAQVMLSLSTGNAPTYIALGVGVVTIISVGAILIKKYV